MEALKNGKELGGKDGVLAPMLKRLLEAAMEGEMDAHLKETDTPNRRNGRMGKKVKTGFGSIEVNTPRDRNSSFEPEILPKRQTTLGASLDHKVISLYGIGMSYADICAHLEELYGVTTSPATLSAITDRVIDEVKAWQGRPLESVYPFVWLDAIHYKVKENGGIRSKAVYCMLGVNREGIKELLGMYVGENEGARFWLSVISDLQNRGVKDIIIASVDNLKGLSNAIKSVFPHTEVQLCIVHQIRNSMKNVPYKQRPQVVEALKAIYTAPSKDQAEVALAKLEENWGGQYPAMVRSWLNNWEELSNHFKYPDAIRKRIYTTNPIKSFHSQLRKVTKTKRVFPSDMALMKLLYLVQENLSKKWNTPVLDWKQ
ncbi:MAG: IS256 family transposase, partial [Flavobacteriales bacterium]|nr:IS256 family transposase [Flavobacteriales bacterium]